MTNPIEDLEKAEVILITGSNTTENHPVISAYVKRAVTLREKKLIVVDPRRVPISKFAHIYLRPRPGTDVAWINGFLHVIIKEGLHNQEYINERTEGFDELKKTVEKYTPEYVEGITGIPREDLIKAARLYAQGKPSSIVYCMGITQHSHGTDNVKSLANLAMLCGNVGVEGGGVNPLRGQNNVQGACDMGGLPNVYTGYQGVADIAIKEKMERAWGVKDLPSTPGLTVVEMMEKAAHGELKALYIVGENPMVSDPNLNHVEEALKNLEFLVVQDIFLTETGNFAHVVLPSAAFAEKDGTFTNTERRVQRVRKALEPKGEAKEDWKIICELSKLMGYHMEYNSPKEIFEEIRKVTPSYAGITYERLEYNGLSWPCPSEDHPGTKILHVNKFTKGKGTFFAIEYIPPAEEPDTEYPFILTTGRVLYQYHTGTMTMKSKELNEIVPECFVEISKGDAKRLNLEGSEKLRVKSRRGEIVAKALISDKAHDGTIFIPFHWAQAAANRLTNAVLDPISKIPEYKVCAVRIEKA